MAEEQASNLNYITLFGTHIIYTENFGRRMSSFEERDTTNPTPTEITPVNSEHSLTTNYKGTEFKLVIEKQLEKTDLDDNQARLSIPNNRTLARFLTQEEENYLAVDKKLIVSVIDPKLQTYQLKLGRWNYKKKDSNTNESRRVSWSYVLNSGWNTLKKANPELLIERPKVMIQVWSFRIHEKSLINGGNLGLAIVKA